MWRRSNEFAPLKKPALHPFSRITSASSLYPSTFPQSNNITHSVSKAYLPADVAPGSMFYVRRPIVIRKVEVLPWPKHEHQVAGGVLLLRCIVWGRETAGRSGDGEIRRRGQSARKAGERLRDGVCDSSCVIRQEGSICAHDDELYSFIFSVLTYFSS